MATIDKRLQALPQQQRGIMIFQQDWVDGSVYYDFSGASGDRPYCQAELGELSAQGWQVLVLRYDPWPPFADEE
jgi:hypothetical protein